MIDPGRIAERDLARELSQSKGGTMPTWDIWMHFAGATGESPWTQRIASDVPGDTFPQVCESWARSMPGKNEWDTPHGEFNPERLTVWGCPLAPTKEEAE